MKQLNANQQTSANRPVLLEAKNIMLTIEQRILCQPLSFSIRAGEMWGLLGPNGCGKTTLLLALTKLYPLTQGEVLLRQKSLKHLTHKQIARHIGLLFQQSADPLPQTVWSYCLAARYPHLSYFAKETAQDEEKVLNALQTVDLIPLKEKNIAHLSGGEKRRLAIAAVLAQTPELYLLDEPANHLDIRYQVQLMQHFQTLVRTQSCAALVVLHDINMAQQFCDHVLLLFEDGHVLQGKTKDSLTAQHLTQLYQWPLSSFSHHDRLFWLPDT